MLRPQASGSRLAVLVTLLAISGSPAIFPQGGPPLITDDPGTPGDGNWEINIAFTAEKLNSTTSFEAPLLDINYGLGERIQLKLEAPWVFLHEDGERTRNGPGNSRIGVKWRFLDQDVHGLDASVYPQFEFNNPTSSADRGLVEDATILTIPFQFERSFGRWSLNPEAGFAIIEEGKDEWAFGLAAGYDVLPERLEIIGEIHLVTENDFGSGSSVFNVGFRWGLGESFTLLAAAGRSLRDSGDEPRFIGYLGLQILFSGKLN